MTVACEAPSSPPRRRLAETLVATGAELVERGVVPDALVRLAIRRLLAARRREATAGGAAAIEARNRALVAELLAAPVAIHTREANQQHYELPPRFFERVLGPHLKYSSALWSEGTSSLAEAEEAMLATTAERALLADGQEVLDLGCGWGSLTLWIAARYPASRVLAVSNSRPQREYILARAAGRGLRNVEVVTADVAALCADGAAPGGRRFDRIVSVEMLEHVRNYGAALGAFARWLAPGGRLFVHVFCHHAAAYPFEVRDASDWMARYFFTGGMMPSADLLPRFVRPAGPAPLALEARWRVDGTHYARTAEAWLANMDAAREELLPVLAGVYGEEAERWWMRWRVFFLACAELFACRGGAEWEVAHYRFA